MKKIIPLILVLVLAMLSAFALAESVAELATAAGMTVESIGEDAGPLRCDYTAKNSTTAIMEWTDGSQAWRVSGAADSVAHAYADALFLGGWERCLYTVGNKARLSYGAKSKKQLDSLADYAAQIRDALGVTTDAPDADETTGQHYVLNTNTKKFHYPKCDSAKKIKDKNRKDYTGSRDDLIKQGYDPCKSCNP